MTSKIIVIGTAMRSATARSLPTCVPTSVPSAPPMRTVTDGVVEVGVGGEQRLGVRRRGLVVADDVGQDQSVAAVRERRPGACVAQYDVTPRSRVSAPKRCASASPVAVTAALSTVPVRACTRKIMSGSPPNFWSSSTFAWLEADDGSSNPPLSSRPNTPTPSTAQIPSATRATVNTSRARATMRNPSWKNIAISRRFESIAIVGAPQGVASDQKLDTAQNTTEADSMSDTLSNGQPGVTRRERRRLETIEDIKRVALEQLSHGGPHEISMRAIARDLGMTASAIGYYFPGRSALVEALILDGYNSLSAALRAALDGARRRDPARQWLIVSTAHRAWALEHAAQYLLLYGNEGSTAARRRQPALQQSMSRVVAVLFEIMHRAVEAGEVDTERLVADAPKSFRRQLAAWRRNNGTIDALPDGALIACMISYAQLHGAITLDLVGHLPPSLADRTTLFELEMAHTFRALGPGDIRG